MRRPRRTPVPCRPAVLGALATAVALAVLAAPAPALADPVLDLTSTHQPPTGIPAGGHGIYRLAVSNTGDAPTDAPVAVEFSLPPESGLQIESVTDELEAEAQPPAWDCAIAPGSLSVTCAGPEDEGAPLAIPPGEEACQSALASSCAILITLAADPGLGRGSVNPTIGACGGGAATCAGASNPIATWLRFDVVGFEAMIVDESSQPYTQAGGHPFEAVNTIEFARNIDNLGLSVTAGSVKDSSVELPPGLIGDPTAYPRCEEADLVADVCDPDSQVGIVDITATDGSKLEDFAVYNLIPPYGRPAQFGFNIEGIIWVHVGAAVRPDGTIVLGIDKASQLVPIAGAEFSFWGVPAASSHDAQRDCHSSEGCSSGVDEKPFISLPTSCAGPLPWTLHADSWQYPEVIEASAETPANEGCNALDYSSPATKPSIEARPTTNAADAPSGLDVDIHTPQNEDPEGLAEAHLRNATLTLPEGLVVNPSSANGLGACGPAQIGIDPKTGEPDSNPVTCPDASKLGTVQVDTPLLDHPAPGAIYLAQPFENPSNSLIALYIVIDDPQSGTLLKLAGRVHLDPDTGRVSSTFEDNPQLPFEHLEVHVESGAAAPLRTPAHCATFNATAELTPWSAPDWGPPVSVSDTWAISQGPGGGACPSSESQRPNSPSLDAGTVSPIAASYTPLVVDLRREDGSQELSQVSLTPPPGLLAKLAGVPYCSEASLAAAAVKSGKAEQQSPSCPAASELGTTSAAAGAGPAPYHAPGRAYLAGPYKGAPLSLAVITPAVAGPFDLGTIVVRVALRIDPATARVTAVSDPIPRIIQGIPLDVRSVQVRLDKPEFTLNGTSCDPLAFEGTLTSTLGQSASLSQRFQLAECTRLGFKPRLSLKLKGATKRGKNPRLIADLAFPEGSDANIAQARVRLPRAAFLDQAHIRTICTRVQFAADACPRGSVYGKATATSPLLEYPVSGPVILRSSDNKLPDLIVVLEGPDSQPIEVELSGRTDSLKGALRNSFEAVPDVPASGFHLELFGGKRGLVVLSRNLCAHTYRASVELTAHNGKVNDTRPALGTSCKGRKGKRRHRGAAKRTAP